MGEVHVCYIQLLSLPQKPFILFNSVFSPELIYESDADLAVTNLIDVDPNLSRKSSLKKKSRSKMFNYGNSDALELLQRFLIPTNF